MTDDRGLRVLRKQCSIANRYLLLLQEGGQEGLDACIRRLVGKVGLVDMTVHDFDRILDEPLYLAGIPFQKASSTERLLNTATFVLDLAAGPDYWLQSMGAKSRNAVRRAEALGVTVKPAHHDTRRVVSTFLDQSEHAIHKHKLKYPSSEELVRMINGGHLHPFEALSEAGDVVNVTMIYRVGDTAFYMFGSNSGTAPTGTGQFVHLQVMKYYKDSGCRWYDLGGVNPEKDSDPIFRFKRSLGGALFDLGPEWRHTGKALKLAINSRTMAKRLWGMGI